MAAIWRLLPEEKFWGSVTQKEIISTPLLCDFGRLIQSNDQYICGLNIKDMLFTTVALYGSNLSEMTSESLFAILTKTSAKTLLIFNTTLNSNSSSFSNEGINKREKEEGLSNPAEVDKDEQVLGEFDEIFSDSDSCDTSSDESETEVDLAQEFKNFVAKIRLKKTQDSKAGEKSSIEKQIVGAVTYDRSYRSKSTLPPISSKCLSVHDSAANCWLRLASETVLHIHLLAVRKKYRKCGVGSWLLERMKDPGLVGTYDAVVTFADPSAVDFFTKKEFSDDLVLNSRYRKIDDNWLNSTPMCFIPHFSSCLSNAITGRNANGVVTPADIRELERKLNLWRTQQSATYQSQMICVTAMTKQLKILQNTVDCQQNGMDKLKSEIVRLRREIKDNGAIKLPRSEEENEESRISYDFIQQFMAETDALNVQVINLKKASVGRGGFYSRLELLKDPMMFTELYFCGGSSYNALQSLMENGFSKLDFTTGSYGRGIYFSRNPRKAMECSPPGSVLVCLVGLGNTVSLVKEDQSRTTPPIGCDSVLTIGRQVLGKRSVIGQEYVIYEAEQAIPIYLVEFEVEWTPLSSGCKSSFP